MKKDNRTKILSVALKLLNEQDSQSVTTNHIAEAAGVSTGNLYYLFKNKEEMYARFAASDHNYRGRWQTASNSLKFHELMTDC